MTLYNKQGKAFEIEGLYCKHCASPGNTPNSSDNEQEAAMVVLTAQPTMDAEVEKEEKKEEKTEEKEVKEEEKTEEKKEEKEEEKTEEKEVEKEKEKEVEDSTPETSVTDRCTQKGRIRHRPEELPVVNEAKAIPQVQRGRVLSALLWLQSVLFFKEKKRNIFMLVLSAVVVALVFVVKFFTVNLYVRCPDG